jgi:hypothetical protein
MSDRKTPSSVPESIGCSRVSDRILENESLEVLFTIPSRQLARILLQTKNGIGHLESPVIARVFGMALAIFPV